MNFESEKQAKFAIDRLRFTYHGVVFKGNGFLEWNPSTGFHIDALLDRKFSPVDMLSTSGQILINSKPDTFPIWLHLKGHGKALIPMVFPGGQRRSFPADNYLSMDIERVVFFNHLKGFRSESEYWAGSASFTTKREIEFPDEHETTSTMAGVQYEHKLTACFAHEEDGNWDLTGRLVSANQFELSWSLHKARWSRADAWKIGEASRKALSLISAQPLRIETQNCTRGAHIINEIRVRSLIEPIQGYCHPLSNGNMRGMDRRKFNKEAFLKLVVFFLRGGVNANVSWMAFRQMVDASMQKTIQGKELMLTTILEAMFRTLNNRPYVPMENYVWRDLVAAMENFRGSYLPANWDEPCDKFMNTIRRVRNKNAHPDWLTSDDGGMSKSQLEKSLSDMTFVSRFYGYMILAMAGFINLEPNFPAVSFAELASPTAS